MRKFQIDINIVTIELSRLHSSQELKMKLNKPINFLIIEIALAVDLKKSIKID